MVSGGQMPRKFTRENIFFLKSLFYYQTANDGLIRHCVKTFVVGVLNIWS